LKFNIHSHHNVFSTHLYQSFQVVCAIEASLAVCFCISPTILYQKFSFIFFAFSQAFFISFSFLCDGVLIQNVLRVFFIVLYDSCDGFIHKDSFIL
jgi:hypothetical protein